MQFFQMQYAGDRRQQPLAINSDPHSTVFHVELTSTLLSFVGASA
jgi:hypothetical protein